MGYDTKPWRDVAERDEMILQLRAERETKRGIARRLQVHRDVIDRVLRRSEATTADPAQAAEATDEKRQDAPAAADALQPAAVGELVEAEWPPSNYDYGSLDSETRVAVQQRTSEIRGLMHRAAQDIVDIGLRLIEVKERLPHGAFGAWLEAEFEWSDRTAQRFMAVAEAFGRKSDTVSLMEAKALYLLAANSTPESARTQAIAEAEGGSTVTHARAKEIIAEHASPEPPPDPCAVIEEEAALDQEHLKGGEEHPTPEPPDDPQGAEDEDDPEPLHIHDAGDDVAADTTSAPAADDGEDLLFEAPPIKSGPQKPPASQPALNGQRAAGRNEHDALSAISQLALDWAAEARRAMQLRDAERTLALDELLAHIESYLQQWRS